MPLHSNCPKSLVTGMKGPLKTLELFRFRLLGTKVNPVGDRRGTQDRLDLMNTFLNLNSLKYLLIHLGNLKDLLPLEMF